jgi:hypothetical protein
MNSPYNQGSILAWRVHVKKKETGPKHGCAMCCSTPKKACLMTALLNNFGLIITLCKISHLAKILGSIDVEYDFCRIF